MSVKCGDIGKLISPSFLRICDKKLDFSKDLFQFVCLFNRKVLLLQPISKNMKMKSLNLISNIIIIRLRAAAGSDRGAC